MSSRTGSGCVTAAHTSRSSLRPLLLKSGCGEPVMNLSREITRQGFFLSTVSFRWSNVPTMYLPKNPELPDIRMVLPANFFASFPRFFAMVAISSRTILWDIYSECKRLYAAWKGSANDVANGLPGEEWGKGTDTWRLCRASFLYHRSIRMRILREHRAWAPWRPKKSSGRWGCAFRGCSGLA